MSDNTRKYTKKFLELMDEDAFDLKKLCQDLLGYMSEDDVEEFALANDYLMVVEEKEPEIDLSELKIPFFEFQDTDDGTATFNAVSELLTANDDMTGPILNVSISNDGHDVDITMISYGDGRNIFGFTFNDMDDLQEKINLYQLAILNAWKKYYSEQNGKGE